jgi:hypothetical protein
MAKSKSKHMAFCIVVGFLSCYKEQNVLVPHPTFCVCFAHYKRIFCGAECLTDCNCTAYRRAIGGFWPPVRVTVRLRDILGRGFNGSWGSSVGIVTRLRARPGRDLIISRKLPERLWAPTSLLFVVDVGGFTPPGES